MATSFEMQNKLQSNVVREDFEFFLQNYCRHSNEKGSLYTWGSGEMGQLGYSSRIIGQMPKDRDGYPFQVSQNSSKTFRANFSLYVAIPARDRATERQGHLPDRRR